MKYGQQKPGKVSTFFLFYSKEQFITPFHPMLFKLHTNMPFTELKFSTALSVTQHRGH